MNSNLKLSTRLCEYQLMPPVIYDLHKKLLKPSKFLNVLGNGEQQKPYSNVEEIIDCMEFIKNKKFDNKLNFFNIGNNDKGIKVKHIANFLLRQY